MRTLAQIVGLSGKVVGVDNSQTMLDEASKRSEGLDYVGEFHLGDIHHLPFADATFDGCRTERVLIHSNDPAQALREMVRVIRPGGLVVVVEPDLDSVITTASNHELARKMTQWRCDSVRNGWIGRQLPGLFHQCGLTDIRIIPTVMTDFEAPANTPTLLISAQRRNILTEAEVAEIMRDFQQRGEQGQYLEFSVVGRKQMNIDELLRRF
jgi:ubiquinone/menaquinone biosynthesis C-methylase UbiE